MLRIPFFRESYNLVRYISWRFWKSSKRTKTSQLFQTCHLNLSWHLTPANISKRRLVCDNL